MPLRYLVVNNLIFTYTTDVSHRIKLPASDDEYLFVEKIDDYEK
jgi:hypothetical protein